MSAEQPSNRPRFSWDRVPAYAHLGKVEDDFTDEQLDFLADHFDFVTIEKGQALRKRGSTEEGIYEVARQLKRRNPRMTVLFYWNAFINYPLYRGLERFETAWILKDRDGKEVRKDGRVPRPDLSLPEVRDWWSDVAAEAMQQAPLDGIFADALPQALSPALSRQLGEQKAREVVEGLREMLRLTRQKMGQDKILLANGLRGTEYRQILDWEGITGAIIEHFGYFRSDSPEDMRADLDSFAMAEAKGKSIVLKGWPGFCWLDRELMSRPHGELLKLARQRITFPLACYLIGANNASWFCYSWGYREQHGMLDDYPELDRPLGPPKSKALWEGFTATREFAHALVSVDLAQKAGHIAWNN